MGLISRLKQGIHAARNPPTPQQIEASLAALSPEQRAAYDEQLRRAQAGHEAADATWRALLETEARTRPLWGPAGEHLLGRAARDRPGPAELQRLAAGQGTWAMVRAQLDQSRGEFTKVLGQTFNRPLVDEERDPHRRAAIAAEQRAARDAARAPYRAPAPAQAIFTRISTRGASQLADVCAHLASSGLAARPDLVFGCYRVPDRISQALTPHSERGRVVEWDVVHAPADGLPPAPAPAATAFAGAERWVARGDGEPSVLDEDLALAYLATAGLGPEHSLGMPRMTELRAMRGHGDDEGSGPIATLVLGVVALHPDVGTAAFERLRAAAPLALPVEPEGVHVETLNWAVLAAATRPRVHHPPPVPSPFPYLPSTPEELLRAYLEVVGVAPQDSYGVAATVDEPRALQQGGVMTTNIGPRQPCADGKARMRTHGCELLVLAYRDTPEYAAGRDRWARYQAEVLQARLELGVHGREPIASAPGIHELPFAPLRGLARVAEAIDWVDELGAERVPAYRYCGPR